MRNKIDYGNNMLCMQLLWAERTDRCCCTTSVTGACPLCHGLPASLTEISLNDEVLTEKILAK